MKRIAFLITLLAVYLSLKASLLWPGLPAATAGQVGKYCISCLEEITGDDVYCEVCSAKLSIGDIKSKEEGLIKRVEISRENYKNTLSELARFYLSIGDQLRFKKASIELNGVNEIPQPSYDIPTDETKSALPYGREQSIEEADILFYDANSYRTFIESFNRKKSLTLAIKRYERLIEKYPTSDKVSDAAYFIAEIYSGALFGAYEDAAAYYVKCYELNPATSRPALYKAARMYDYWLKNPGKAIQYYELASENSSEYKYRKKAKKRLEELKVRGGS